jgi:hypothetical protein
MGFDIVVPTGRYNYVGRHVSDQEEQSFPITALTLDIGIESCRLDSLSINDRDDAYHRADFAWRENGSLM